MRAWKAWRPSSQPMPRRRPATPMRDLADEVPADPRPGVGQPEAAGQQQQGQVHEREGEPVVEPGLRGEGEPDVVVLVRRPRRPRPRPVDVLGERLAHLHVGGQHRVGRRERWRRAAARPPVPGRRPTSRAAWCRGWSAAWRPGAGARPATRCATTPRPQVQHRSMARPTPMRETSTVNSVTWVMSSRLSSARGSGRPQGQQADSRPTPTSTIGGDSATRRVSVRQECRQQQGQAEEEIDRGARHRGRLAS